MARTKHRLDAHDECLDALTEGMEYMLSVLRLLDARLEQLETTADGKHLESKPDLEPRLEAT